jgi:hypothetical protein
MSKVIKSMVKTLRKLGINLDVDGLEAPVGEKHLVKLIDGRKRLANRSARVRKPKPNRS